VLQSKFLPQTKRAGEIGVTVFQSLVLAHGRDVDAVRPGHDRTVRYPSTYNHNPTSSYADSIQVILSDVTGFLVAI
jgi:hypothetical protein